MTGTISTELNRSFQRRSDRSLPTLIVLCIVNSLRGNHRNISAMTQLILSVESRTTSLATPILWRILWRQARQNQDRSRQISQRTLEKIKSLGFKPTQTQEIQLMGTEIGIALPQDYSTLYLSVVKCTLLTTASQCDKAAS